MARSIQDLREKRNTMAKDLRNLVDNYSGDKWTAEINEKYDGLMADIDRLDTELDRIQKVMDLEAQNFSNLASRADRAGISADEAKALAEGERRVLVAWIRGGDNALTPEQAQMVHQRLQNVRNLGTQVPSEGGFLSPDLVGDRLLVAMKAYGGMRESGAQILGTNNGNTIPWPTTDPTAEEGEIVGENAAVTEDDTITFGQVTIGAHMYSSKAVAVPFQLLQDSMYDIEGHIIGRLGMRLGRITNRHFTVGTGNAQPKGVVVCAGSGVVGATGQSTSMKWDNLQELEHSLDPAYRQSGQCRYMFHDTTLLKLKKMKDGQGRPLWLPGVESLSPNTVNGYPYVINQDVAEMAADAKSVLFGRFDYYVIRDVLGFLLFRMTDSAYTKKAQVGFLAFSRHDGNLIAANNGAVKYFQNSST